VAQPGDPRLVILRGPSGSGKTTTAADMRGWYLPDDRLGVPGELTIGPDSTVEDTVDRIAGSVPERPVAARPAYHPTTRVPWGSSGSP
jgi:ABC-type multidrug transport system ATPase subunit